jgi:outer membrane protein assembly factor BamE (lipoprotein component of BamABCDE complex)
MRTRPMHWFGVLACVAVPAAALLWVMTDRERDRYDLETVRTIQAGMTVGQVEEVLGRPLASIIYHRTNPDRSYVVITTRKFSYPLRGTKDWNVAEITYLVRFNEDGIVSATEEGGTHCRGETFLERFWRSLGF